MDIIDLIIQAFSLDFSLGLWATFVAGFFISFALYNTAKKKQFSPIIRIFFLILTFFFLILLIMQGILSNP